MAELKNFKCNLCFLLWYFPNLLDACFNRTGLRSIVCFSFYTCVVTGDFPIFPFLIFIKYSLTLVSKKRIRTLKALPIYSNDVLCYKQIPIIYIYSNDVLCNKQIPIIYRISLFQTCLKLWLARVTTKYSFP